MTERTDFIATLQACYFGDKNAFEKVLRIYDEKQDRIDKAIEVIDTQMKLAEDEAKDNLRIIKFYLIKGSCSMYDLTTEEDYKYKKGGNNEC